MSFVDLFLIAVGLSMDAFAVSVCKGLGMSKLNMRQAVMIAVFFGGFQALMPLLGWLVAAQFSQFVSAYAHWIAFALLAFVGAKMLKDAFGDDDVDEAADAGLALGELSMLAVATSIDALAVGVSFAFLDVAIGPSVALIGATTFVLSLAGVAIGHQFGARWEKPATVAGGIILIGLGCKILLEHMGLLMW